MPYLLIYVGTIVVSEIMDFDLSFQIYKDVADAGGKLNNKKMSSLSGAIFEKAKKFRLLYKIVPIVNIAYSFATRINYENKRIDTLRQLEVLGMVDPMDDFEKKVYNEKPTKFNAAFLPVKCELRLSKADRIEINNNKENSKIYYEMPKDFDENEDEEILKSKITILKVEGDASNVSLDEQKEKVLYSVLVNRMAIELKNIILEALNRGDENLIRYYDVKVEDGVTREENEEYHNVLEKFEDDERDDAKDLLIKIKMEALAEKELQDQAEQKSKKGFGLHLKRNKQ